MQMCIHTMCMMTVSFAYYVNIREEEFFGIFNFSDQEKTAWMQEDVVYRNLLTSEKMELKDIRLRGYDFLWCEK